MKYKLNLQMFTDVIVDNDMILRYLSNYGGVLLINTTEFNTKYGVDLTAGNNAIKWFRSGVHLTDYDNQIYIGAGGASNPLPNGSYYAQITLNPGDYEGYPNGAIIQTPANTLVVPIRYDLKNLDIAEGTHTIQVKARASGYKDSEFSNSVSYSVIKLATPVISLSNGVVSWSAITNASYYELYIDDVFWSTIQETSIDLNNNISGGTHSLKLKACANSEQIQNSNFSNVVTWSAESDTKDYFYIENAYDGTNRISFNRSGSNWSTSPSLQYSKNKEVWSSISVGASKTIQANERLYFRNLNSDFTERNSISNTKYIYISGSAIFDAGGNIMSLIDKTCTSTSVGEYKFKRLFYNSNIRNANNLKLPATTLGGYSYDAMFSGCSHLLTAPTIATASYTTYYCYASMFSGCTSLVNAPAFELISTDAYCCSSMFSGCTSLVDASSVKIRATNSYYCCTSMFSNCTSLSNPPILLASSIAMESYSYMFKDCTSLVNAPALPASSVGRGGYEGMFSGCTSLVNAPSLPARSLSSECYRYMFKDCTSLVNAPALYGTSFQIDYETYGSYCYTSMFENCVNLETLPALPVTSLTTRCYAGMFKGCTKIKLSTTRDSEYTNEYRIPVSGTGELIDDHTNALHNMFENTGGTFTGTPSMNVTYYTSNTVVS